MFRKNLFQNSRHRQSFISLLKIRKEFTMFRKNLFQNTRHRPSFIMVGMLVALIFASHGCSHFSNKQKGGVIGGTTGGVVGGVIGKKAGHTAVGAILGAAVGGASGAYIGHKMDKQADEIEKEVQGAKVERIGEGIHVSFDSNLLFAVNEATLTHQSQTNLQKFAGILQKYADTDSLIEGHTDSTGTEAYNLTLSQQRAQSVANYLTTLGVSPTRLTIRGYGESQPITSNDTPEDRQANRRVEIAIVANEKLKAEAQAKTTE